MTLRFRVLGLVPLTMVLALLLAPSASADSYTDQLVDKFNAQTHVVADPAATPPLQNPDRINQQILTGPWSWSSTPPVWVAAVAPAETGVTTPDAIHNAILGRNPEFSGVVLVIDSRGYHVRAYNVPQAVADSVDPLMRQSARDHRNDPYDATSEFVNRLSGVNVTAGGGPVRSSPVVHEKHNSFAWLWATLAIVAIGLAAIGLISFAVGRNRKRRNDAWERDQVKQELIAATSGVSDIDNAVMTNSDVDVSSESMKANSSLHDARKAYEAGDFGAARAHLRVVESTVARAYQKINPGQPAPNVSAVTSVPEADRKQASVQTKNPATGESVTINNNNYSTTPQLGYPHYYGGGYYNGMFFYPGYYPYAFWGPGWGWALTDVLLMDSLLDDHWGGSYDRGFEGGYEAGRDSALTDANYDSGQSAGYDSQQGDVGFGGYQGGGDSGFGGGDVGFGGNDSGGGYDSGGGGFDFGGFGGSDSGGGGFDFGGGSDSGGGGDFSF